MKLLRITLTVCVFFATACNTAKQHVEYWTSRPLEIDNSLPFTRYGLDTVKYDEYIYSPYKMFVYVDSTGCTSCQLQLDKLNQFVEQINQDFNFKLPVLLYFNNKNINKVTTLLRTADYDTPVFIDNNPKSLLSEYRFSEKQEYNVFLLDSTNKVIVIGYPIQNEKIKNLYHKEFAKLFMDQNRKSE